MSSSSPTEQVASSPHPGSAKSSGDDQWHAALSPAAKDDGTSNNGSIANNGVDTVTPSEFPSDNEASGYSTP
ncbi:hypothetical protein EV182_006322, partial [Spiromyces aspiralis]